ncbi:NYN domain-containing protein [Pseudomonas sp. RW10S2]|uniref:NYN domain-containing protein n=1 Tax=Pseudomonas sp. RW10S2 TaxID=459637 RepID=UPI00164978BD|nr:NYN domain-containing protein [Pseudomonas sp. RW10S2]MBC3465037.1 NYN domain-containing protein [Pseudomonas sp. RW10S2]
MDAHIFIDNSNVFGGAQRAAEKLEPGSVRKSVRIYYRNLFKLIEDGFKPVTKILAGSLPPGNEPLWEYSRAQGYNTDLLHRVDRDDGRLAEQGVDEIVHLKIANVLLDFEAPQVLVLVTGDGNESDFGTSFLKQVERALKRGWEVHVWSWQDQQSGKYARLAEATTGKLVVHQFDPFYKALTFIQEGDYNVNGASIHLAGRVVDKLKL